MSNKVGHYVRTDFNLKNVNLVTSDILDAEEESDEDDDVDDISDIDKDDADTDDAISAATTTSTSTPSATSKTASKRLLTPTVENRNCLKTPQTMVQVKKILLYRSLRHQKPCLLTMHKYPSPPVVLSRNSHLDC